MWELAVADSVCIRYVYAVNIIIIIYLLFEV